MAKTNEQKKGNKEINKKAKKISKKIMNKVEDTIENEQINDLEMEQKNPQTIETETTEKSPQNEQTIDETPAQDVDTEDLINVLKVPMQNTEEPEDSTPLHEAVFDKQQEDEPEEDDLDRENLNDRYFGEEDNETTDDFDSQFFEDETLMAEMGVEVIDLAMQTLAMGIARDFDNPEKYAVSDFKKKKIKKPLELLLRKRGAKVSPEVMFGVVLLVVYAPTVILAVQERKEKMKAKKKPRPDVAEQIPDNIQVVQPQPQAPPPPPPQPMVIPQEAPKKKGRPKGSKDTKKRSTKGYKGNTNSKE